MTHATPPPEWFIDIRQLTSPEQISLDLSRHLPRRAAVGPVAVIAERPTVLLSVIKKRWSTIIREVQRQYSSTLHKDKKEGLRREINRLHSYEFATVSKRTPRTNILFSTVGQLRPEDSFMTVYLTMALPHTQLLPLMHHISPRGFLVTYTGWPEIDRSPIVTGRKLTLGLVAADVCHARFSFAVLWQPYAV